MSKITINSELDLFDKTGNSAHARWVAERLLSARKNGAISEVELAVFDASLASDFGTYKAYQAGLSDGRMVKFVASDSARLISEPVGRLDVIDEVDRFNGSDPVLSKVAEAVSQAREYLSMTRLHFDEKAIGAEHLMHYIRMAEVQINKALSCDGVEGGLERRKVEPKRRGEYPSHHFPHHQSW